MRKASAFLFLTFLVAACGKPPGGPPLTGSDYKIYEQATTSTSSLIEVIDSRSQSIERSLPLGTLSADLHHLYSVARAQLSDIDPQTGSTRRSLKLSRAYTLPAASMNGESGGLSPNGRWLALQAWDPMDTTWPSVSHFLVVDTSFASSEAIDLAGWFEFDAISNDGQRLYLIEYLAQGVYRVRVYDVAAHMLDPTIVVDKTDPTESMTGQRVMGVVSPDGAWLYSVYVRESAGPFVHALSLSGPYAFCIDLPGPGSGSSADAFGWSLALAGGTLFAVNPALGVVDGLDLGTGAPRLARTARIDSGPTAEGLIPNVEAKEMGGRSLVTRDGRTLVAAGPGGLAFIDTTSLHVRIRALDGSRIFGLGLTPDGQIVYAATGDRKITEISTVSARVGAIFDPAGGMPITILAVDGPA